VEIVAKVAPEDSVGYETVETSSVDYRAAMDVLYFYDDRLNLVRRVEGDPNGDEGVDWIEATYEYDALDRLVAANLADGSRREYVYDASTRRLADSTVFPDGTRSVETHLYAPGWETIADCGADLAPVRAYVLGGGGMDSQAAMLRKDAAGEWQTLFYLRDHLGSVLALVDGAGAIVESYEYAPYGAPEVTALDGASPRKVAASVFDNRMLYTGREWDAAADLYHYRHRTYSPREHRFMQGDPIGLGGGWNYYSYVHGDPINLSDPLGLDPEWHHLLPRDIFTDKIQNGAGIDINDAEWGWWTSMQDHRGSAASGGSIHNPVNGRGWNDQWSDWVDIQQRKGNTITPAKVRAQLTRMKKKPEFREFFSGRRGMQATVSYGNRAGQRAAAAARLAAAARRSARGGKGLVCGKLRAAGAAVSLAGAAGHASAGDWKAAGWEGSGAAGLEDILGGAGDAMDVGSDVLIDVGVDNSDAAWILARRRRAIEDALRQ